MKIILFWVTIVLYASFAVTLFRNRNEFLSVHTVYSQWSTLTRIVLTQYLVQTFLSLKTRLAMGKVWHPIFKSILSSWLVSSHRHCFWPENEDERNVISQIWVICQIAACVRAIIEETIDHGSYPKESTWAFLLWYHCLNRVRKKETNKNNSAQYIIDCFLHWHSKKLQIPRMPGCSKCLTIMTFSRCSGRH